MKKFLILMLALVMVLSVFSSCTVTDPDDNDTAITTEQALKNAIAFVKDKYKVLLTTPETAGDFDLATSIPVGGVIYSITWTVDNDQINVVAGDGQVTIDVPDKTDADIDYKLTAVATAADGTKSEPLVFNLTVPAFKINTIEEYYAAEKDELIVFEGIVTGIVSTTTGATNKCLFLQDKEGKGGVYVYGIEKDPVTDLNIEIGMTVRVSGAKDIYNGTHELKPTSVEIISAEKTEVTPIDLTEAYTAAADLKAETLVGVQGALVTVKGIEITGQEASSGYYKFKLGELESYIRISGSTCAINKDDQTTFIANHTAKLGYKADATGIVSVYNGAFYLVPVTVDAFSNFTEVTRTDAEKVEFELEGITFTNSLTSDGDVTVALVGSTYENVTFTWAVDNAELAVVGEGKITFTIPEEEATVKVTVTAVCGEVTGTKEFEVKLSKTIISLEEAISIGNGYEKNTYSEGKYIIAGVITEVQNDKYGNIVISDGTNSILIYGMYLADGTRYDAMTDKPVVGDYIVVVGVLGKYNDPQMKNGTLTSITKPTSVEEAIALGNTFEKDNYTEEKHLITGVITEVQNEKYGNVVISDGTNTILVYGLYSFDGAVRYDAMAVKPAVGDTITVLGIVGKYNDPQVKNGWLISLTPAAGGNNGGETETGETETSGETETGEATTGGETGDVSLGTAAASLSFTTYANRTSFDAKSAEVWESNGLKITHAKGDRNNLRDTVGSSDTQLRVYTNATLTIEFTGITKVVLTVDASHTESVGRLDSFVVEGATTQVVDGKAIITLPAAANSVVVKNTNSSQIRIISVDVYTE